MFILPIGTDVRPRQRPWANYALIAVNVVVFLLNIRGDSANLTLNASVPALSQYLTYQFLHGDIGHLLGNMLFLYIFGNAVCDRMGGLAYLLFYLAGGVFSGVVFSQFNSNPMLGASGAIAAITTAFLVLYPRVQITMLVWIFFYVTTFTLPSSILIIVKVIVWDNIIAPNLDSGVSSNVAHSAHLAGYLFGFAGGLLLLATRALPRSQFDALALWNRWRRRTGLMPEPAFGGPRSIRAEELQSRPLNVPPPSPVELLRGDIAYRLAEGDVPEAMRLYHRLISLDVDQVLPMRQQLVMANYLAKNHEHQAAARAYENFLRAYPTATEVPQVRLFIGLLYNRYLKRFDLAIEHLRRAAVELDRPMERQLAEQELQHALRAVEPHGPGA